MRRAEQQQQSDRDCEERGANPTTAGIPISNWPSDDLNAVIDNASKETLKKRRAQRAGRPQSLSGEEGTIALLDQKSHWGSWL